MKATLPLYCCGVTVIVSAEKGFRLDTAANFLIVSRFARVAHVVALCERIRAARRLGIVLFA